MLELPANRLTHVLLALAIEWNSVGDEQVKYRQDLLSDLAKKANPDAVGDDEGDPGAVPALLPEPDLPPSDQVAADLPIPGLREQPLGVNTRG